MSWKNHSTKISNDDKKIFIPQKFNDEILLHIFKNIYANIDRDFKTPLILSISGAPGMGKTYQTKEVLRRNEIKVFEMNGSDFENEYAGIPIQKLIELYSDASDSIFYKENKYCAIVIDDIDAALGQWGNLVQYTMNRQLLIKTLIDLADNPYKINKNDNEIRIEYETSRIPIIITMNDETKMYSPLMRNGRTKRFQWVPGEGDVCNTVNSIFDNTFKVEELNNIIFQLNTYASTKDANRYKYGLPISLFSDIKSCLYDEEILKIINKYGLSKKASSFFGRYKVRKTKNLSVETIYEIGQTLIDKNYNYL